MYQNALEGIRVIDFSWVVAGPFCTKLLGLMGAEVIKIESASRPQYKNRGAWFSILNNSKKSCTINLSSEEGKALVKKLISISDVVVENFSTGVMDRLGLGYVDLQKIKADIIYATSSGLGRTGPAKDYLAYGSLLQGLSGWTSLFNEPNPTMEAMGVIPGWTDPVTGTWETLAIQAALFHRSRTGKGLYIDLSMIESTISIMGDVFLDFAATGKLPKPGVSSSDPQAVPHGVYPCEGEDSWIAISVGHEAEWNGLRRAMGNPMWCQEKDLVTLDGRLSNRERIDRLTAQWTARLPAAELFQRLQSEKVPAGPCYNLRQLVEDPHMELRGLFQRLPLPEGRTQLTTAIPWRDETDWKGNLFRPPQLGEHNDWVFLELLGVSSDQYEEYVRAGFLE